MEYIIYKNKLYMVGTVSEIKNFFKEKTKIYNTFKELIDSESNFICHSIVNKKAFPY